jgi:hypothetical protein
MPRIAVRACEDHLVFIGTAKQPDVAARQGWIAERFGRSTDSRRVPEI